jgi:transposase
MSDPGKEVLYDLYWNQGKSLSEISKIVGNPFQTVWYWMRKYNIPCRSHSEAQSGELNGFYRKSHTKKTKEYISKINKGRCAGEKNPFYGKKHTKETIEILREKNKKYAKEHPEKVVHGLKKYIGKCGNEAPHWQGGKIKLICDNCGKKFEKWPKDAKRIKKYNYCSKTCQDKGQVGERTSAWKGGSIDSYGIGWKKQRRKAIERDEHICQMCGKPENGRGHDVHHLVPFQEFGIENYKIANQLENLITLCHPCHCHMEVTYVYQMESRGIQSRLDRYYPIN